LTGFGLFAFDWDFNLFGAAEAVVSWHSSKDGLFDKVVMRDDLVWSDGTPITAHDVVFSFR
jgi:peptide/nickel transport system substrate-binding protein